MKDTLFEIPNHIVRSAEISQCGRYRWWLRRSWQLWTPDGLPIRGKGVCCFLMLNPSTADTTQDDPTIRRCIGFAKSWGYNTLSVRNIFPWRATDPKELLHATEPTGGARGDVEVMTAATADLLVAAWGSKVPFNRDLEVLSLFEKVCPAKHIYCLKKSKEGSPWHPLYVKADTQPLRFR